jgi:hypothetical protein
LFQRMPACFPASAQLFVVPCDSWIKFGHRDTRNRMLREPPGRFKA